MLKPGWYILNYHEVNWEESAFLRSIGGTLPPDYFYDHCTILSRLGELIGIEEGVHRLTGGGFTHPCFSFWFDDGLVGVNKFARPILESFGTVGAVSVNSRFADRHELFWRFKLSYLHSVDGIRFVRSKLKAKGFARGESVKQFVLDNFDRDILAVIDTVYNQFTTEEDRLDAFRAFDTWDGIRGMRDAGWVIANHTAAHYPVAEPRLIGEFCSQFKECDERLAAELGAPAEFWVVPFDRANRSEALYSTFESCSLNQWLVLVGNRRNLHPPEQRYLSRVAILDHTSDDLVAMLRTLP